MLRVLQDCGPLFRDLEHALASSFLPAIFGIEVSLTERDVLSLPLRMGGLGIGNPMATALQCYSLSIHSTTHASLVTFITGASLFELDTHIATVSLAKDHYCTSLSEYFNTRFDSLFSQFDPLQVLCYMLTCLVYCQYYLLQEISLICHVKNLEMLWPCTIGSPC